PIIEYRPSREGSMPLSNRKGKGRLRKDSKIERESLKSISLIIKIGHPPADYDPLLSSRSRTFTFSSRRLFPNNVKKVTQQSFTPFGQNGFRMILNPFSEELTVPDTHYLAPVGLCGILQARGKGLPLED